MMAPQFSAPAKKPKIPIPQKEAFKQECNLLSLDDPYQDNFQDIILTNNCLSKEEDLFNCDDI